MPETGRTHQLRVHCSALGAPILGDFKYGGKEAVIPGFEEHPALHLHARSIRMPHPAGGVLEVKAPLPRHMRETFAFLGFASDSDGNGDLSV
jgi:23S rRNA pseudouridine955/2504/2580 synthase